MGRRGVKRDRREGSAGKRLKHAGSGSGVNISVDSQQPDFGSNNNLTGSDGDRIAVPVVRVCNGVDHHRGCASRMRVWALKHRCG